MEVIMHLKYCCYDGQNHLHLSAVQMIRKHYKFAYACTINSKHHEKKTPSFGIHIVALWMKSYLKIVHDMQPIGLANVIQISIVFDSEHQHIKFVYSLLHCCNEFAKPFAKRLTVPKTRPYRIEVPELDLSRRYTTASSMGISRLEFTARLK